MAVFDTSHGGGKALGPLTVTDDGSIEYLPNEHNARRYAIITASRDNSFPIFLRMHQTEDAIYEAGVPLWPGDSYELNDLNLYTGPIKAITAPGETAVMYIHDGV
jgi:hypothetical protein